MNTSVMEDIVSYLVFLRGCGYSITVSNFHTCFSPYLSTLLEYEIHLPAVCGFLKTHPKTTGKCIWHKRRFEKAEFPQVCYRCCYAGVEEFVYPIYQGNVLLLCVNISGYRGQLEQAVRLSTRLEKRCGPKFKALYQELSTDVPSQVQIESLAAPLRYMVIELYRQCQNQAALSTPRQRLCQQAQKYMYENYMYPFHCRDLADTLGYSESHFRSLFQAETGMTPTSQMKQIRLSRGAFLLEASSLSIAEIALSCGFESANYFATAFHQEYHISPREYRKQRQKQSHFPFQP